MTNSTSIIVKKYQFSFVTVMLS